MKTYAVLIAGSGATRGMAAKVLTERGQEVLLMEAGPKIEQSGFLTHSMPYEFPFPGEGSPSKIQDESSPSIQKGFSGSESLV